MTRITESFGIKLLGALALALAPASLQAGEITVPSGAILTIQQAVDAAAPGDTIIVLPGTYGPVSIGPDKRSLTLKAAGPPGSVQVVGSAYAGVSIQADDVTVQGFEISQFAAGVVAVGPAKGVKIADNRIGSLNDRYATGIGILSCAGAEVARNTLFGPLYHGILLDGCSAGHVHGNAVENGSITESFIQLIGSTGCEVDHNTLDSGGAWFGIFLNGYPPAGPNTHHHLHHNRMKNQSLQGIFLWNSPNCVVDHNVCNYNEQAGIWTASSDNGTVDHNEVSNNGDIGLAVGASPHCTVAYNVANNNRSYGINVWSSCGSAFSHNSAEGNGQWDLFAPGWEPPTCNTYSDNRADTASPSLSLWNVK